MAGDVRQDNIDRGSKSHPEVAAASECEVRKVYAMKGFPHRLVILPTGPRPANAGQCGPAALGD